MWHTGAEIGTNTVLASLIHSEAQERKNKIHNYTIFFLLIFKTFLSLLKISRLPPSVLYSPSFPSPPSHFPPKPFLFSFFNVSDDHSRPQTALAGLGILSSRRSPLFNEMGGARQA